MKPKSAYFSGLVMDYILNPDARRERIKVIKQRNVLRETKVWRYETWQDLQFQEMSILDKAQLKN